MADEDSPTEREDDFSGFYRVLEEGRASMNLGKGRFCRYRGNRERKIVCAGIDPNCQGRKLRHCELHSAYKESGILGYYGGRIDYFEEQGVNGEYIPQMRRLLEGARLMAREKNFSQANSFVIRLHELVDGVDRKLKLKHEEVLVRS